MKFLLGLWQPKNKFCKILKGLTKVIMIIIFFAFLVLPFIHFEKAINDTIRWIWIGCAVCNIDSLVEYKKYYQQKLITPLFTMFSILTLTYLYNYWALLSLAIIVCVSIVIGLLEFIVSVAVYRTIRFSEKTIEKELPSKAIQGIVLGGLYACAVILFILGHHISENMIFTFGVVSAIMLSVSVLICLGNGISSKKSIFSVVSFIVDTLSLLALIIYLIYLIPNDKNLQNIVLTIIASVIGGALTLAGVAWTIRKTDKDRREEEKKKAKPIFSFVMQIKPLQSIEDKKVCFDSEETIKFPCNVTALLENSERAVFSVERVYHDKKWWKIQGNKVLLPKSSVYLDFNFSEDVNNLFMEIKDSLDNLYYYEIKVLSLDLLTKHKIKDNNRLAHTIREIREVSFKDVEKRINEMEK